MVSVPSVVMRLCVSSNSSRMIGEMSGYSGSWWFVSDCRYGSLNLISLLEVFEMDWKLPMLWKIAEMNQQMRLLYHYPSVQHGCVEEQNMLFWNTSHYVDWVFFYLVGCEVSANWLHVRTDCFSLHVLCNYEMSSGVNDAIQGSQFFGSLRRSCEIFESVINIDVEGLVYMIKDTLWVM